MPDQATLNHAAQIIAGITADLRADTALRFYFEGHRYLQPPAKRHISRTVFAYFRWLGWLEPKAPPQRRLEQAVALQDRFQADPKSVKAETLAVRAVPEWLWTELDLPAAPATAKADYLRQRTLVLEELRQAKEEAEEERRKIMAKISRTLGNSRWRK